MRRDRDRPAQLRRNGDLMTFALDMLVGHIAFTVDCCIVEDVEFCMRPLSPPVLRCKSAERDALSERSASKSAGDILGTPRTLRRTMVS